jgi:hypothetical protein
MPKAHRAMLAAILITLWWTILYCPSSLNYDDNRVQLFIAFLAIVVLTDAVVSVLRRPERDTGAGGEVARTTPQQDAPR